MGRPLYGEQSDSPAMVLPPQQTIPPFERETHYSTPFFSFNHLSSAPFQAPEPSKGSSVIPAPSSVPGPSSTPLTANPSRKRSHDEITTSTDGVEVDNATATPASAPEPEPEEQPIYGEGMVLLNPRSGLAVAAESQTGTWYEQKAETNVSAAPPVAAPAQQDPTQFEDRSRKLQRIDVSSSAFDDITAAAIHQKLHASMDEDGRASPLSGSPSTPSSMDDLRVDDFTHLLGISWQRISADDNHDMAGAIRGWEKYINNHYARYVQDSRILSKHRGLNAFLVASRAPVPTYEMDSSNYYWENDIAMSVNDTGKKTAAGVRDFYLFNENLTEARLVARDWETCVMRLQSTPITFAEGSDVITPATASRPLEGGIQGSCGGKEGSAEAMVARTCAREATVGWEEPGQEFAMDIDT